MSVGRHISGGLSAGKLKFYLSTKDNVLPKWVPFDILQSRSGNGISIIVKAPIRGDDHATFTQPRGSNGNNDAIQQGHVLWAQKGFDDVATALYHDAPETIGFQGDEQLWPDNLVSASVS